MSEDAPERSYMSGGEPKLRACLCGRSPDPGIRPGGGCWCTEEAAEVAPSPRRDTERLRAILTGNLYAITRHPAWDRVDGRAWAGATRSDMADVVIEACLAVLGEDETR